jgi:gamma-glutamylcyclotransferase (GGCT)/AIG2-like uncharacterized protein YtfP
MNDRYVFVYGTLRKGATNAIDRLTPAAEYVGHARVRGVMYNFGEYPGLVLEQAAGYELDSNSQVIVGEVWKISQELEQQLDAIEAQFPSQPDEFLRNHLSLLVTTASEQQQTLECLIYSVNAKYIDGLPVVASGDWMKR